MKKKNKRKKNYNNY